MITGLAHACFRVADLDRSLKFYRDGLGLSLAFEFKNDAGRRTGLYLKAGGRNFIELFEGKPLPPTDGQSFRHICLEVDDMDATVKAFRAQGIEVTDPKLGLDQSYQAWLTDPDGNKMELHAYTPKSWQAPHLTAK
jgi:glyoxylase I family protein